MASSSPVFDIKGSPQLSLSKGFAETGDKLKDRDNTNADGVV